MRRKELPKNFTLNREESWKKLTATTALEKKYPKLDHKIIFDCLMRLEDDMFIDCFNDIHVFKKLYKDRKKVLASYKDFVKTTTEYVLPLYHTGMLSDEDWAEFGMEDGYERLTAFLPEATKVISFLKKFPSTPKAKELTAAAQTLHSKNVKYSDNARVLAVLIKLIPYLKKCGVSGDWELASISCELINRVIPEKSAFTEVSSIYRIMKYFNFIKPKK